MMKSFLVISILIFGQLIASAMAEESCAVGLVEGTKGTYRYGLSSESCRSSTDCWVQFKAPEDAVKVSHNGKSIINLLGDKSYVSNESFLLPLAGEVSGDLLIEAQDTNQNKTFPKKLCLKSGSYFELRWKSALEWFLNTGITLFSAYFLFLISIFLLLSFWFRKSGLGLSLFIYSFASFWYLISFSEYPRSFFDPVMVSGGIHFPLRLLQDVSLLYVFYNFYQKYESANVIKYLSWVYAAVISMYGLLIAVGIRDYVYFARIIIFFAPLVAAPMAIGTWFAFKTKDPTERKVLIPSSLVLLAFQLNDLFVFWKVLDGYYTVKFYIPVIVGMSLFLYFRRMHSDSLSVAKSTERNRVFNEFLHDVKSPLAVLRIQNIDTSNRTRQNVINAALDRIENMVTKIDAPESQYTHNKIPLVASIQSIVAQKKVEFPQVVVRFEAAEEVFVEGEASQLQRIVSNLLNNAFQASRGSNPIVDIKLYSKEEEINLRISDYGAGIPEEVRERLFKEIVTTKATGKGIGLNSAQRYLDEIGGRIEIISKENFGTTVDVILKRTDRPPWFVEDLVCATANLNHAHTFEDFKFHWGRAETSDIIQLVGNFDFHQAIEYIISSRCVAKTVYFTGDLHFDDEAISFFENQAKVVYVRRIIKEETRDLQHADYILVDDDKYVRISWEDHAKRSGHAILTFSNIQSLISESTYLPKSCPLYLDLNINGKRSTDFLAELKELGFERIILATGENSEDLGALPFIEKIVGKLPPQLTIFS